MKVWNTVKFILGLQCIAKFGDKYVVTRRDMLFMRVCLACNEEYWWTHGYWNKYCTFDTLEQAEKRAGVIISESKPALIKLTPVVK